VPYVEGWALYTQQMMSEEGFLDNSVELRLTFYKQLLRSIAKCHPRHPSANNEYDG